MSEEHIEELKRKTDEHTRAIVTLQVEAKHTTSHLQRVESVLERLAWLVISTVIAGVLTGGIALAWQALGS